MHFICIALYIFPNLKVLQVKSKTQKEARHKKSRVKIQKNQQQQEKQGIKMVAIGRTLKTRHRLNKNRDWIKLRESFPKKVGF